MVQIELVLYGTDWWCLYETSNINSFIWIDRIYDPRMNWVWWPVFEHQLVFFFLQMMEVTIVNTNRNSANDMIFLPNDLQSYYIVLVHHLYALTLCMSEMLNIWIIVIIPFHVMEHTELFQWWYHKYELLNWSE